MTRELFKNSFTHFVGLFVSKFASVLVFILLAKALLPQKFGEYTLWLTIVQIITFFADFGLTQWYQKRAEKMGVEGFMQALTTRGITGIVSLVIIFPILVYTSLFSFEMSMLLIFTLIPEALHSFADSFYIEKKEVKKVALKNNLRVLCMLVGYFIFQNSFSLTLAAALYCGSSYLTVLLFFPWGTFKKLKITKHIKESVQTMRSSFSYAALTAVSFLYSRGDALLISMRLGTSALGIYGSAYRYLESLSIIPAALFQNLFPLSAKEKGFPKRSLNHVLLLMAAMGFVIGALLYIFAPLLITYILGPEYSEAIILLRIFSFVVFFFFINAPLAAIVQSSPLVHIFLPFGVLNTVLNLVGNFIFLPIYGIQAAAFMMLVTEIIGWGINMVFVQKVYKKIHGT